MEIGVVKREGKNSPHSETDLEPESQPFIPGREKEIFEKLNRLNKGPLTPEGLRSIWREILSSSIKLQEETKVAYLGPRGTHSYQAASDKFGESVVLLSQNTIEGVFDAVERGRVKYGVVPFENSTFGSVVQTLDRLVKTDLRIRAETYLVAHHCLLSNSPLASIKRVYSHPQALGHCQTWLERNLPYAERCSAVSTSHASELAAREVGAASISSIVCADLYGLNVVERNIEDLKNNTTRFFIIGTKSDNRTGNDKSLIRFTVDHREPGALCDGLKVFKDQGINLTKIDSRPSRERPWHYVFFVECVGHFEDPGMVSVIRSLKQYCLEVVVLGSYPIDPAGDTDFP